MSKKIILQIDGGGILGMTPAMVLAELEKQIRVRTGKPNFLIRDMLTLCCGTSTGAIIAGFVAAGIDAAHISKFYSDDGIRLFRDSRNSIFTRFFKPKFKRDDFLAVLDKILQDSSVYRKANVVLSELPKSCTLMATAYNLCSHRTHFIKSSDDHDQQTPLRDLIAWSALSAAYYFGKINAPGYTWILKNNGTPPESANKTGAVFQDGGQGTQNCTLDFVLTEILSRNWGADGEEVVIISLGTGSKTKFEDYSEAKDTRDIGQTIKYLTGQARDESTTIQELAAAYVQKRRANIKLFRLDYETTEDYALDDTEHTSEYQQGARSIIASSTFAELMANISAARA